MVPKGTEAPKKGDFIHWSELSANAIASGSHAHEVRSHLKVTAKSAWQLVSWLTHASGAVRSDAELALNATHAILASFGMALLRIEAGVPGQRRWCGTSF